MHRLAHLFQLVYAADSTCEEFAEMLNHLGVGFLDGFLACQPHKRVQPKALYSFILIVEPTDVDVA